MDSSIQVQLADATVIGGPRIAFWIIAAITVGGALLTITRRNPIAAVMSLVATFFGLAATYAMLSAHFLAALQVLVYAGAIMVLFIFVVMVLNREELSPVAYRGIFYKALGGLGIAYGTARIGGFLLRAQLKHPEAAPPEFGTVAQVGEVLFTDYLFAFEVVSVLLLIAVIAAVVVARTHQHVEATAQTPVEPSHEEAHA